jgi:PIN domain nuclease of toxin-antitoxin system
MKYLLDTHVLLWWLVGDARLSQTAMDLIADPENNVLVSSASAWEIAIKHRLGKLGAPEEIATDLPTLITRARMMELPISLDHAIVAGGLDWAHRDPFDRMLVAQADTDDLFLITNDATISRFSKRVRW